MLLKQYIMAIGMNQYLKIMHLDIRVDPLIAIMSQDFVQTSNS